jgi:polar amino acid transport system substrate-binding protein
MTLQGLRPAAGAPWLRKVPHYLFLKNADSSRAGNAEASHAPPPPRGGRAGAKGAIISYETGFLLGTGSKSQVLLFPAVHGTGIMRNFFTCTIFLVVLCLLLAAAGCTGSQKPASPAAAGTAEKTYIVGIDGQYQPFSYVDSNGNAQGFDVDAMRWIAEKKGMKVTFSPTAWDGIIPALQARKIDLIYAGMTITPERAEQVNFSIPYWEVNQDVVARAGSNLTLDEVKAGKAVIGTQSGCTAAIWIDRNLISTGKMPQGNLKLYDNTPLAVDDLTSGRIDAVMYDDLVLKDIIANKSVKKIGNIETREEFGIAVRKSDPDLLATLNDGLVQLKADPYWQELIKKYNMK